MCQRRSKPIRQVAFTCCLLVLALTSLCHAQDTSKQQASSLQFLFVQSAQSFTYTDGKLSLHGVSPYTIYFTDRPVRIAGHIPVKDYIDWGRDAKDSFTKNPPNGTLSIIAGDEAKNIVMVLKDAELEGDMLSYKVRILEGEMPPEGGVNSLFIDIIGMPLTPLSFAGVHRRWRRRAIVYGAGAAAAYGAAAATAAAAYTPTTVVVNPPAQSAPAPAAPPPAVPQTTESKLRELKNMLDSGLISQSDYESKKKQLLANF
jgi:hypothetical protein